ncbi:hypothetical protein MKMG_01573 [Methanogenium sp. MK-MG]|nr:hypothetical protein MKMG_01573 [Methanogenium sp. MK-MG]
MIGDEVRAAGSSCLAGLAAGRIKQGSILICGVMGRGERFVDYLYIYLWAHPICSDLLGFFLRDCTPVLPFRECPGGGILMQSCWIWKMSGIFDFFELFP